jgi:hypothetical protein
MSEIVQPKHWIVRVQDGENFRRVLKKEEEVA